MCNLADIIFIAISEFTKLQSANCTIENNASIGLYHGIRLYRLVAWTDRLIPAKENKY